MENGASNILYFALVDALYPGKSSYEVSTGGKLRNLRESTTNAKVRAYHKKYYQTQNLYLTITGNIEPEEIFEALDVVERKVVSKAGDIWQRQIDLIVCCVLRIIYLVIQARSPSMRGPSPPCTPPWSRTTS